MTTEKTTYLGWDKPVFPSDTLAADLDALFDQIDVSVNNVGGEWSVSDDGAEVLVAPGDLNFGTGLSVTDDTDGTVTLDAATQYTDTDAVTAVNTDADHGSTAQHDYYTDSEAVSAVNAETILSVDVTGDADTVDGKHANELGGDQIFHAEGTNTNINASNNISWNNTILNDAPYSFDGTTVTIQEGGTYEIEADADFTSSIARTNANIGIHVNGNWAGVIGRSGYVRDASGHNASSVHTRSIQNLSAGDAVLVHTIQESASEMIVPNRSQFSIKKLNR